MASIRKPADTRDPRASSAPEGKRGFPRRDFLNGILVASSAAILAACGDKSTSPPSMPGGDSGPDGGEAGTAGPDGGDTGSISPQTGEAGAADAQAVDANVEASEVGQDAVVDAARIPKADKGDIYTLCHEVRDGRAFTLPAPAASEPLYDCIVVGGGISGLVAAWKLRKLGHDNILVLEKDDPVGGLSRMDGGTPTLYARATAYTVLPFNDDLIGLYQDLGMVSAVDAEGVPTMDPKYVVKKPVNSVYMDGKWYVDAWEDGMDSLPLSAKALADLKAFREDMLTWYDFVGTDEKMAFDTPTDASTSDAAVRALDKMTLAEYIASKGWDRAVADFFGPYCKSALGTTVDKVSAWSAINFLGSEFGICLSQPGGNGYLSKTIADKVGSARIRTNAFVLRVKSEGTEMRVSYHSGGTLTTLRAKTVIYAAPRFMARYVLPDLVAAGRDEASAFEYSGYAVANVHVSKTPPGLGYDNWVQNSGSFITDFVVADWAGLATPETAPESRPNVLTVYCPMVMADARTTLLEKPIEYFEERVLADLERVLPGVSATVTGFDLYRWGHAMVASKKGFVFSKARLESQSPLDGLFFACTDVDGLPAFENAVGSATRAANEVADALRA